jgi:predicted dehydrogenase/threonine dehydrogenase-like Zn-dependent dehydrogenase
VKQVCLIQGRVAVVDVPPPTCGPGGVLVRTSHSLISTGTEMATTGSGGGGLVRTAVANPQLVRKVWEKLGTVGLRRTLDLVRARRSGSLPLGYSAAGEVVEVGAEVRQLRVGDRVACAGVGYANHAELNLVPQNLVAPVPPGVPYAAAAFATLGAIALQGVRRLGPGLGERVVVLGLGLVGQLTAQLLRAAGCRVLGVDVLPARVELARKLGMEDGVSATDRPPLPVVQEWSGGVGADGVVVCASGGDGGLLNGAFDLCRPKGRVVLVGDVPIRISREKIYRKELDFLVSCSYGPGRYDPRYEAQGIDYPLPYVRWTEGRNLGEMLRLLADGTLRVSELTHAVLPVADAVSAYQLLQSPARPIAVLLDYGLAERAAPTLPRTLGVAPPREARPGQVVLGVVGAGAFFRAVHLPNLSRHGGFSIRRVATRSGLSGRELGMRHGIPLVTTDAREVLEDPEIAAVLIATRHDLHAPLVLDALRAGKHVFVEKPLALGTADCEAIVSAAARADRLVAVGFNRRFAPLARTARDLLARRREPRTLVYRVNAGPLAPDHWLRDPREGGGRLLGEGVHFFDLLRWLVGTDPVAVTATALHRGPEAGVDADNASVSVAFADGSLGTLHYVSQGHPGLAKERIEIFGGGQALVLEDFRTLEVYGVPGCRSERRRAADKGHFDILANFHAALNGAAPLGASAEDGYWATWCAEQAQRTLADGPRGQGERW